MDNLPRILSLIWLVLLNIFLGVIIEEASTSRRAIKKLGLVEKLYEQDSISLENKNSLTRSLALQPNAFSTYKVKDSLAIYKAVHATKKEFKTLIMEELGI